MNIANVIGWRFNNQSGMCCKEIDGVMQITAFPVNIPSQVDQDLWTAEYNAFIAANEYSVLRRVEYDKLNQDEMRYDDLIGDTTTWRDAISAIKIAIPKP